MSGEQPCVAEPRGVAGAHSPGSSGGSRKELLARSGQRRFRDVGLAWRRPESRCCSCSTGLVRLRFSPQADGPAQMWEPSDCGAGEINQLAKPKASASENIEHTLPGVKKCSVTALLPNPYDRYKALAASRFWRARRWGGNCRFCRLHILAG